MKHAPAFIFILMLILNCEKSSEKSQYLKNVGDIEFDTKIDDPNFKICNEERVLQYYNFGKGFVYKGEKIKIIEYFHQNYDGAGYANETGYITIRFIVNCEGKTGRFRVEQMDNQYNRGNFNKKMIEKLLSLTKSLNGWETQIENNKNVDYYQYLTFKMENGSIIEILP
jgi:hypothetical protein